MPVAARRVRAPLVAIAVPQSRKKQRMPQTTFSRAVGEVTARAESLSLTRTNLTSLLLRVVTCCSSVAVEHRVVPFWYPHVDCRYFLHVFEKCLLTQQHTKRAKQKYQRSHHERHMGYPTVRQTGGKPMRNHRTVKHAKQ